MSRLNVNLSAETIEWEPWDIYFPGAPACEGESGGWVKVLRRPDEGTAPGDGERGWTFLFKWVAYPGKAVRHKAVVPDDSIEEVYMLTGAFGRSSAEEGAYVYRGRGAPHGAEFGDDFTCVLHYDGPPDIILSYEFVDR